MRPRFFPPETKASIWTLPVPAERAEGLRRWKLQCRKSEHDPVFPIPDGQPMHRSTALRHGLWPALRRAGLRRVHMHSLRHSFASALVMAGISGDRGSGAAWTLQSGGDPEGLPHRFRNVETDSVDRLARTLLAGSKICPVSLDAFKVRWRQSSTTVNFVGRRGLTY